MVRNSDCGRGITQDSAAPILLFAWKLEEHEDTLKAIITGNPKQSLRSVWKQLKDAKVKVSYETVETHLERMGYRRNRRGELRLDRATVHLDPAASGSASTGPSEELSSGRLGDKDSKQANT
jgi:hypothetical protein